MIKSKSHSQQVATKKSQKPQKKQKHILRISLLLALGLGFASSTNAFAAGLITTTGIQALMATETVNGSTQQTAVTVGPLTNDDGSSQQSGLQSGADSSSLAVVPINASLGTTVYSSNQAAANAVSGYLQNYLQTIANAVIGSMKSSSTAIQLGMFTYIQNVQIANPTGGAPTNAQVYATVQVQPNGSYQYLGANVNNNTLYLLYAIYQQSKDAAYLPAGWTVPNSGETQWELDQITIEGNSIQSAPVSIDGSVWHIIQDNGAYDGVESVTNGVEKINYAPGVASWIKNQISPLMNQYNASMSVAMYGEQVKVSRNSSGQPLTAISVNSRVLEKSCGSPSTFVNSGQYGYLLTEFENEYIVQPNGSYSDAGQVQKNTISPTQNYTESASVPSSYNDSQLEPDVVFPIAPDAGDIINWQSGSPLPSSDYVYMAPITDSSGNGNETTEINSAYGPINVCVSPNEDIITGSSMYFPGGCGKDGCSSAYSETQSLNIEPVQIDGNPDNFLCNYAPGSDGFPAFVQCAMEMDTTYIGTVPSGDGWTDYWAGADIIVAPGTQAVSSGLPVGYQLPNPSWNGAGPEVGPSETEELSYDPYSPPPVNEFDFAVAPGSNYSLYYAGMYDIPPSYDCTPSGCVYNQPSSFVK